jgi:hypothetical protein
MVPLVAHNCEIAGSIPAGSSNKFEKIKNIRCWLNMTMKWRDIKIRKKKKKEKLNRNGTNS